MHRVVPRRAAQPAAPLLLFGRALAVQGGPALNLCGSGRGSGSGRLGGALLAGDQPCLCRFQLPVCPVTARPVHSSPAIVYASATHGRQRMRLLAQPYFGQPGPGVSTHYMPPASRAHHS